MVRGRLYGPFRLPVAPWTSLKSENIKKVEGILHHVVKRTSLRRGDNFRKVAED